MLDEIQERVTIIKIKNYLGINLRRLLMLLLLLGITAPNISINVAAKATSQAKKKVVVNVKGSVDQNMSLILNPRQVNQLNQFIYQTVTPGSTKYRHFITPTQFAKRFGQSTKRVDQIVKYLQGNHLNVKVQPGNLILNITGSTNNFNRAFGVKIQNIKDDGIQYQKTNRTPSLPTKLNGMLLDTVGLSKDSVSPSDNLYPADNKENYSQNKNDGTPQKFMDRYNMDDLYEQNKLGNHQSVGIISFGSYRKSDVYKFWNKMNIPTKQNRLKNIYSLNSGKMSDSTETTLDIQQAGAMAPKANINVYMSQPSVLGMVSSLTNAISDNQNSSIAISWGQSEHKIAQQIKLGTVPTHYNEIMNLLLMQAAAQGISVFAATGDSGAYDGMNINEEYPYLSVDTPSNSPYVTAVGGTTLPSQYSVNGKTLTIEKERAWGNEYLYPNYRKDKAINSNLHNFIDAYFSGTGGGFSKFNATPDYQKNVSGVGTFQAQELWGVNKGYLYSLVNPKKIVGTQDGRNLPDVSANADPNTGYLAYYHGRYIKMGGTSVVAPQFAGASATINSALGQRVGFWNPQIYRLAQQTNSPFTKLDSDTNNTNLYYVGQPGKLYNQATGLGTVDFGQLTQQLRSSAK